jgi:hypothetical protein
MTLRTNARLAGFAFLLYIATGLASMVLFGQATGGEGTVAKLASIAQHATNVRLTILLTLLMFVYAVVLGVTLYALTRDEDRDIALVALCCRVAEGVIGAVAIVRELGLIAVATGNTGADIADAAAAVALGGLLLKMGGWTGLIAASCFAIGSTLFSYLFLRARSIPVPLAWLGVLSSLLILVILPLQLAGFVSGPVTGYMWIPIALFEVVLAFWLIIRGVRAPGQTEPA